MQSFTSFRIPVLFLSVAALCADVSAKSPFSLVTFSRSKEVAKSSHLLTEENGPWMIFVSSFAGESAEREARQLVERLREEFGMKAYLHKKHYDFEDAVQGKGFDKYGNPKKMRHFSSHSFDEIAVLIGDYESVNDAKLQKQLNTIKYATAEELSLRGKDDPTTRRFATLRSIQKRLITDPEKQKRGPLRNAFATRNPMIPDDDRAPGLDPLILEMNKGRQYSLLDNPGKYSVRIASYRGNIVIDQKEVAEIEENRKELGSKLDDAGDKAEKLTKALRHRGIEAYVYHDRYESIVTVGSFAEIGTPQSNGQIELHNAVADVIETFGPSKKPLQGAGGVTLEGIQPKALDRFVFDVAPQPIIVPRRSIGDDYAANR